MKAKFFQEAMYDRDQISKSISFRNFSDNGRAVLCMVVQIGQRAPFSGF